METTKLTALLSTECQCEDEEGNIADSCADCGEWMEEGTRELFTEWLIANGDPNRVTVKGKAMGWQRLEGEAIIESKAYTYYKQYESMETQLLKVLTLRGDFTIRYTLENGKLTAIRYSHDEPTGATFEFIADEVTA